MHNTIHVKSKQRPWCLLSGPAVCESSSLFTNQSYWLRSHHEGMSAIEQGRQQCGEKEREEGDGANVVPMKISSTTCHVLDIMKDTNLMSLLL